jgi:hypothetical protein
MSSAFGVDHELYKAYKKIRLRLVRSGSFTPQKTDTLQERQRVNYRQWRSKSGDLQREMNPRRWDKNDAANLKAGLGPPHPRSLESRAKGEARAREKARNLKLGAQAMISGHANAGKKNRYLP